MIRNIRAFHFILAIVLSTAFIASGNTYADSCEVQLCWGEYAPDHTNPNQQGCNSYKVNVNSKKQCRYKCYLMPSKVCQKYSVSAWSSCKASYDGNFLTASMDDCKN